MSGVGYIGSLREAQEAIAGGRDKVTRPMKSRSMRLWYTEGDVYVYCYQTRLFRLTQDHVELVADAPDLKLLSQTLHATLPKVFKPPMFLERESNGTYSIRFAGNTTPVFKGMKFRWDTGECVNSPAWANGIEIPEVRRQWLRDMRAYKRKVKSMERLGVISMDDFDTRRYYNLDPHRGQVIARLVSDIKNGTVDNDLLKDIVMFASTRMYYHREKVNVIECVDHVFSKLSMHLRREYGVFG
jgi:hypothetical protein